MASPQDGDVKIPLLLEDVDEENPIRTHPHDEEKGECLEAQDVHARTGVTYIRSVVIVAILSYLNLIYHVESSSAAGVLPNVRKAFNITDSASGLLHAVFIGSYMLLGPVFGYLGDRWNRKYIMCAGTIFWSAITLCTSFIPNEYFPLFLLTRGLAGAGKPSFSIIAPSVIADLFVADQRSRMLSIFHLAAPIGSGLGYIVGSKVSSAAGGDWHWAFRVTPGLGLIAAMLIIFFMKEPPRGAADRKKSNTSIRSTNWKSEMKQLIKNRSFISLVLGCAAVAFASGPIDLWAPTYLKRAHLILQEKEPCQTGTCNYDDSLIFGVIKVASGILGVVAGVEISKRFRKVNSHADPLVCACGLLSSAPFLFLALILADTSLVATYVFIFLCETLLSMNFAVVTDILLAVVPPTSRSKAQAIKIVVSHLLGDAGSPYLIGFISDLSKRGKAPSIHLELTSLKYALMTCAAMEVIGGVFFLVCAYYIRADREKAETESED